MRRGEITAYKPTQHAVQMHESTAKETVTIAPIRSGKTRSLIYDVIRAVWNNTTPFAGLVIAPTYRDLQALVEGPLVETLRDLGLLRSHNWQNHETILKNGKRIYYRSAEEPERIKGLNIFGVWVDEFTLCKKEAIDYARGRLLLTNGQLKLFGTPKGTSNWGYYEYFGPDAKLDNVRVVRYQIRDNPHITEEAIAEIASKYSPLLFRQEILAEWVNLSEHLVYYALSEANVRACARPQVGQIYIGLDYNIGVNAWVAFWQRKDRVLEVFDEGHGAANTRALAAELLQKFGPNITIVDDASGNIRQQGDGQTNRQILQQCGLYNITSYTSNPNRVDRYANTNAHLCNGLGNQRLFIDPGCKRLLHELNTLCYRKNSDEPDSQGGIAGHITDALGYGVWWISGGAAAWEKIAA